MIYLIYKQNDFKKYNLNNYKATADLAWQAQGTLGYTRPRLLREFTLLTLPRDLGLTSFMAVVATLCAFRTCKYGQDLNFITLITLLAKKRFQTTLISTKKSRNFKHPKFQVSKTFTA